MSDGMCCACRYVGEEETRCPERDDNQHCRCWYEGEPKPAPGALSREQVVKMLVDKFLAWPLPDSVCSDLCATKRGYPHRSGTSLLTADEAKQMLEYLLVEMPDAALRATIEQQAQELQQERDKCNAIRNRFPVDAASWRGVDEQDLCAECGGAGTKLYGNTSTYHYSAGGQAMTLSVCDKCWGSGNTHTPWRSWKLIDRQAQEIARLTGDVKDQKAKQAACVAELAAAQARVKELEGIHGKSQADALENEIMETGCAEKGSEEKVCRKAGKTKESSYQETIVAPAKRLAVLIDSLEGTLDKEVIRKAIDQAIYNVLYGDDNGDTITRLKDHLSDALNAQLQATLAEREARIAELEQAARQDAVRLRGILQAILNADERGQGLPFQEAMQQAQKALKEGA